MLKELDADTVVQWLFDIKDRWPMTVGLACIPLVVFIAAALVRPASVQPVPASQSAFASQWRDATVDIAMAKPREELLPVTRTVRTERIILAASEQPIEVPNVPLPRPRPNIDQPNDQPYEEPTPVPTHRQRHRLIRRASLDICARHNMRKVITRGGKSWRCQR